MAGKRKPVATWSLADLGVAPGAAGAGAAATAVRGAARRPARQAGTVVVDKGEGAAALADFLVAQKLL
jgi:electron transfer flavoprotein beta subunit